MRCFVTLISSRCIKPFHLFNLVGMVLVIKGETVPVCESSCIVKATRIMTVLAFATIFCAFGYATTQNVFILKGVNDIKVTMQPCLL